MHISSIRRSLIAGGVLAVALAAFAAVQIWAGSTGEAEASGVGAATLDGATVRVVGVESSSVEVAVTVLVQGRDELGEVLSATSRPVLIDASGVQHPALRASRDSENPRKQTIIFEVIPDGSATLVVGDLVFESAAEMNARIEKARSQGSALDAVAPAGRTVPGKWSVTTTVGPKRADLREVAVSLSASFGPGRLVVERIVRGNGEVQVFGRIEGLKAEAFEDLLIAPAMLTVDGVQAKFLGGRSGYGENNSSFDLRFESSDGRSAELSVPFNLSSVTSGKAQPAASAELVRYAGSAGVVSLVLP